MPIKEVKKSIEKTKLNERLSVIQWETCAAEIENRINDLPLALGNLVSDFETMDLITPNRLKLGRNNDRSPSGCVKITSDSKKILKTNQNILNTGSKTRSFHTYQTCINQSGLGQNTI